MGMYSQSVKFLVQECDTLLLQFVNVNKILMLMIIMYGLSWFWLHSFSFEWNIIKTCGDIYIFIARIRIFGQTYHYSLLVLIL